MLVRSYLTLGQKDKAIAAIDNARHALTDKPTKLEEFNEALKKFDISDDGGYVNSQFRQH